MKIFYRLLVTLICSPFLLLFGLLILIINFIEQPIDWYNKAKEKERKYQYRKLVYEMFLKKHGKEKATEMILEWQSLLS